MKTSRFIVATVLAFAPALFAAAAPVAELPGDRMLAEYFRIETDRLHRAQSLTGVKTLEQWTTQRAAAREQMLDMLGLSPLPERTDLKAVVTGRVEHPDFHVENLLAPGSRGTDLSA